MCGCVDVWMCGGEICGVRYEMREHVAEGGEGIIEQEEEGAECRIFEFGLEGMGDIGAGIS